jgi:hypothetical protein
MTHIDDFIQNLFYMATDDDPEVSFLAVNADLKALANEKRGGLTVVSFDRSPFKLFSL